jgi:hypothetical protein
VAVAVVPLVVKAVMVMVHDQVPVHKHLHHMMKHIRLYAEDLVQVAALIMQMVDSVDPEVPAGTAVLVYIPIAVQMMKDLVVVVLDMY